MATSMRQLKKNKQQATTSVMDKPQQSPKVDPRTQKQIDIYSTMLTKFIHGKETQSQILEMLQAGNPLDAVPPTAIAVNEQAEQAMKGKVGQEVVLGASVTLVSELLEVGIAAGLFEQPTDEDISFIYQDTLQTYIEKGLKDGSIDPIKLQKDVEPLLTEEQRKAGLALGGRTGVGDVPDERAVIERYAMQRADSMKPKQVQGVMGNAQPQAAPQVQPGGMV